MDRQPAAGSGANKWLMNGQLQSGKEGAEEEETVSKQEQLKVVNLHPGFDKERNEEIDHQVFKLVLSS